MEKDLPVNQGEGDPEAAERFNSAERKFVGSVRGKEKIAEGPRVRADEEAELTKAERAARDHAKSDDSDTTAMDPKR
jgi:hypothetical protein